MLNVFDLTRRSHNQRKLKEGSILKDLEFSILPDDHIIEADLAVIERELNKKKRKRFKAQEKGEMLSPLHSNRASSDETAIRGPNLARANFVD